MNAGPRSTWKDGAKERATQVTWRSWESEAIAPNGRAVRDNFAAWFGDSKVVGASGAPLVLHHGINSHFDAFDDAFAFESNSAGPCFYQRARVASEPFGRTDSGGYAPLARHR